MWLWRMEVVGQGKMNLQSAPPEINSNYLNVIFSSINLNSFDIPMIIISTYLSPLSLSIINAIVKRRNHSFLPLQRHPLSFLVLSRFHPSDHALFLCVCVWGVYIIGKLIRKQGSFHWSLELCYYERIIPEHRIITQVLASWHHVASLSLKSILRTKFKYS